MAKASGAEFKTRYHGETDQGVNHNGSAPDSFQQQASDRKSAGDQDQASDQNRTRFPTGSELHNFPGYTGGSADYTGDLAFRMPNYGKELANGELFNLKSERSVLFGVQALGKGFSFTGGRSELEKAVGELSNAFNEMCHEHHYAAYPNEISQAASAITDSMLTSHRQQSDLSQARDAYQSTGPTAHQPNVTDLMNAEEKGTLAAFHNDITRAFTRAADPGSRYRESDAARDINRALTNATNYMVFRGIIDRDGQLSGLRLARWENEQNRAGLDHREQRLDHTPPASLNHDAHNERLLNMFNENREQTANFQERETAKSLHATINDYLPEQANHAHNAMSAGFMATYQEQAKAAFNSDDAAEYRKFSSDLLAALNRAQSLDYQLLDEAALVSKDQMPNLLSHLNGEKGARDATTTHYHEALAAVKDQGLNDVITTMGKQAQASWGNGNHEADANSTFANLSAITAVFASNDQASAQWQQFLTDLRNSGDQAPTSDQAQTGDRNQSNHFSKGDYIAAVQGLIKEDGKFNWAWRAQDSAALEQALASDSAVAHQINELSEIVGNPGHRDLAGYAAANLSDRQYIGQAVTVLDHIAAAEPPDHEFHTRWSQFRDTYTNAGLPDESRLMQYRREQPGHEGTGQASSPPSANANDDASDTQATDYATLTETVSGWEHDDLKALFDHPETLTEWQNLAQDTLTNHQDNADAQLAQNSLNRALTAYRNGDYTEAGNLMGMLDTTLSQFEDDNEGTLAELHGQLLLRR